MQTVQTLDYHTAGEPFRIVTGGVPTIPGDTILVKREWAMRHLDHVRQLVVNEPRGHADMYGCFLTPPASADAEIGVLFFHNAGFSTACGHGTIALVTAGLEIGMLRGVEIGPDERRVVVDVPSGRLEAVARTEDGRVRSVRFRNVPAYVETPSLTVDVSGVGEIDVAIAYGGAFYAILPVSATGHTVSPEHLSSLIALGRDIKSAVERRHVPVHPEGRSLRGIYGVIFTESVTGADGKHARHDRNVTIFADGEVDRSPCGSGTSARLAHLFATGEVRLQQKLVHESIIGTRFAGHVAAETTVASYPAVYTEIEGRAFRTGSHTFFLDPDDDLGTGFLLR